MKQIQSDIDPPINGEGDVDPRALTPLNRSRNRKAERKKNGVINRNPAPKVITIYNIPDESKSVGLFDGL